MKHQVLARRSFFACVAPNPAGFMGCLVAAAAL